MRDLFQNRVFKIEIDLNMSLLGPGGQVITKAFAIPHNLLIWLLIFAATYALMKALIRIPQANKSWLFWALLLAATLFLKNTPQLAAGMVRKPS